uniref:Uncharacterized protein n=1 Tax=Anguilla anguilla TaxID=7936 RepID=A0A0E9PGA1_ANGAN
MCGISFNSFSVLAPASPKLLQSIRLR